MLQFGSKAWTDMLLRHSVLSFPILAQLARLTSLTMDKRFGEPNNSILSAERKLNLRVGSSLGDPTISIIIRT